MTLQPLGGSCLTGTLHLKSISIAWVDVQFFAGLDVRIEMWRGFQGGYLPAMQEEILYLSAL
jgi:hypothetical protein